MKRPRIGIDLDGCLYPFDCAARNILHLNDYPVKTGDAVSMHWEHLPDEAGAQGMHFLWNDSRRELFDSSIPYPGAVKALHRIEGVADLIIVTHRPVDVAHVTMRWLARYKINPRELHHVPKTPKSEIVHNCLCVVEDRTSNAEEIWKNTSIPIVFVPRRGWNKDLLERDGLEFFDDWTTVADWVTERK